MKSFLVFFTLVAVVVAIGFAKQPHNIAIPGEIELASGLLDFGAATPEIRDIERQRPQLSATSI